MGIQGLLPMLKEIQTPIHIREYAGKKLAIDGYVWLHRGAYGYAEQLATGQTTTKYVNYAMHRVRMLKHFGVEPLVVLDGGHLPSKEGTEIEREKRRTEALAKGNALKAEGKTSLAREAFLKAVDVTPEMAFQLIKALRREGIEYIVAPFEADPQLAYLERQGLVDGLITEDSDLLVFGARTVIFKLDGEGNGVRIERKDFTRVREYNFAGWTDGEFRQMAILSGCDYLDSVPGLGLKTAYRLMRKYKTAEKVIQFVRLEGQLKVPRSYPDGFKRAELTFLHQRVFDPVQRCLVHLESPGKGVDAERDMPFIGARLDDEYARGLAAGDIDPISKLPMRDICPDDVAAAATAVSTSAVASGSTSLYRSGSASSKKASATKEKGQQSLKGFFAKVTSTPKMPRALAPKQVAAEPDSTKSSRATSGIASKFFGGAGRAKVQAVVDIKGKGKAREEDMGMLELDAENGPVDTVCESNFDDDADAEMQDSFDLDAYEAMCANESPARPPSTPTTVNKPADLFISPSSIRRAYAPAPPQSVQSSHGGAISSPPAQGTTVCAPPQPPTPSPVRAPSARRRSASGSPRKDRGQLSPRADIEDLLLSTRMIVPSAAAFAVDKPVCDRHRNQAKSEPPSDLGISSPVHVERPMLFAMDLDVEEIDATQLVKIKSEVEVERGQAETVSVVSSPIATPPRKKRAVAVKKDIKPATGEHESSASSTKMACVELSSDPVDVTSEPCGESERRLARPAKTSQPDSSGRKIKKESVKTESKGQKEPGSSGSMKRKRSATALAVAEDDEVVEDRAQEVVASWKQKFMMRSVVANVKTPQLKSSALRPYSSSLPTPAASGSKAGRPTSKSAVPRTLTRRDALQDTRRTPLSPKAANVPTTKPQAGPKLTGAKPTFSSSSPRGAEATSSDSCGSIKSSSPVIVTNPRLLQFKFAGRALAATPTC